MPNIKKIPQLKDIPAKQLHNWESNYYIII